MKLRLFFLSLLAVLLFLAGIAMELLLSGTLVWAEVEAAVFGTQTTTGGLNLACPLMLSSSESGVVSTLIANSLDQQVSPLVITEISRGGAPQSLSRTLLLDPHQDQTLQRPVNDSDLIFGRLILVNVVQFGYADLDPHRGFCGILVFDLFNLTGYELLILILVGGFLLILVGGLFWSRLHAPLNQLAEKTLESLWRAGRGYSLGRADGPAGLVGSDLVSGCLRLDHACRALHRFPALPRLKWKMTVGAIVRRNAGRD